MIPTNNITDFHHNHYFFGPKYTINIPDFMRDFHEDTVCIIKLLYPNVFCQAYFEMGKQIIYSEKQANSLKNIKVIILVQKHKIKNIFIIMISNILYKKPLISSIQN